jgi:signal transduction histidine kinase
MVMTWRGSTMTFFMSFRRASAFVVGQAVRAASVAAMRHAFPVRTRWSRDAVFDAVVVGSAATLVFVSVLGLPPVAELEYGPAGVLGEAVLVLALVRRRRNPVAVAWLVVAVTGVIAVAQLAAPEAVFRPIVAGAPSVLWLPSAAPFAAYSVMAFGPARTGWASVAVLAAISLQPWDLDGARVASAVIFTVVPAVLGAHAAARRRVLHGQVRMALADERARLATEMHDLVTSRVSLMVLQAGVLSIAARDETVREGAERLHALGGQALQELRDLLGVLRDSGEDIGVRAVGQELVPDLAPLVASSRSAGIPVELVEEGDLSLVAPVVARTAHRVVQEALTNVAKHAPGARVLARVHYGAQVVRLRLENTAHDGEGAELAATGSGMGLTALRQRVDMLGGSLTAGPAPGGGFSVEAILPAHVPDTRGPHHGT